MRRNVPSEYEALRTHRQQTLIAFLTAELDIGPKFVRTASLSRDAGQVEHYAQARENAMNAAGTVRRFKDQVADGNIRKEIETRLSELDRLISTV